MTQTVVLKETESKDKSRNLEEAKRKWWDENQSHGAFAFTQEELNFYHNPERWKTKK